MMIENLTEEDIYSVLVQTLPKQNDFSKSDYSEEKNDLRNFFSSGNTVTVKGTIFNKSNLEELRFLLVCIIATYPVL